MKLTNNVLTVLTRGSAVLDGDLAMGGVLFVCLFVRLLQVTCQANDT